MLDDLPARKARYSFNLIDADGNGLIEVSDFALRAQRLAEAQDVGDDEERGSFAERFLSELGADEGKTSR